MFEFVKESGPFMVVRASDTVTEDDYKLIAPMLDKLIKMNGTLSCLIDVSKVTDITPGGILEDFKLSHRHKDDFKRVAIMGKKSWMDEMAAISNALSNAEIQYFDEDEESQAMEWLEEK
ncbi:MAG: STAS/SEC14 domain-containing protein [Alphaproteobacteria bacterium]|jgi:hypothetical protein|nr:STAS/SEC14 domain-containing protein [Alphaproteobacteria bacterium]MBT5390115.1 STAS/SEC14 domain-containing protein [Alphaproteobacteria bacterium]MBT5540771.1 STAS/SEC14 domain-containing protein [Alphaproteobacteria bacterium]MBT5654623.1 STAS/SEC14 domain-containing protein [Alphaproteobacteria bacterium]